MQKFDSPYGAVVFTDERKRHILNFHPDIRTCLKYFSATLANPEQKVRSIKDPLTVICYKFLQKRRKYLAIVIKIAPSPFIITAYLAKKPKNI